MATREVVGVWAVVGVRMVVMECGPALVLDLVQGSREEWVLVEITSLDSGD